MKRISVFLLFGILAHAQSSVNLLNLLVRGPATGSYILASVNGTMTFVTLAANVTISGNPPVLSVTTAPANTPQWQSDTISLSSLAPTATTISLTTSKTPKTGVVLWLYNGQSILNPVAGAVNFAGNPVVFSLPMNWTSTDTITLVYQWQ